MTRLVGMAARSLYVAIAVVVVAMAYRLDPERPEYAIVAPVAALFGCGGGGGLAVEITQPSSAAEIKIQQVYIKVQVKKATPFRVWLSQTPPRQTEITALFTYDSDVDANLEARHAIAPLPVNGSYTIELEQTDPATQITHDKFKVFSRVAGPTRRVGAVSSDPTIVSQLGKGVTPRPSTGTQVLFGKTTTQTFTRPSASATTTDTDASDGLAFSYYSDATGVQSVLDPAPPVSGENSEDEVWPTAPFWHGVDLYTFYARIDNDAGAGQAYQGMGLAKATNGTLPFVKQEFPPLANRHFGGDSYSLFERSEFPLVRGVVVDPTDDDYLLLYGNWASGTPNSYPVVVARVPVTGILDRASYRFWTYQETRPGSGFEWNAGSAGIVSLFDNTRSPTVFYNTHLQRWVALSTEYGVLGLSPYSYFYTDSTVSMRLAETPMGPWSAPVTLWQRPRTRTTGAGSAADVLHLSAQGGPLTQLLYEPPRVLRRLRYVSATALAASLWL